MLKQVLEVYELLDSPIALGKDVARTPCTTTEAPVVGVTITVETAVPGCTTGANHVTDIEGASCFVLDGAKAFGKEMCSFYDESDWRIILERYGSFKMLQRKGKE